MNAKIAQFLNKGMLRDASISKVNNEFAYENFNIRISPTGNEDGKRETAFTVTNEKGTKKITLNSLIDGEVIGWNVLNNHIVLFLHKDKEGK